MAYELLAVACGISPEMEAGPLALGVCHLQRLLSVSWFSEYKLFTFLVRFILRYFILFDLVVNRVVFSIFVSDSLLLGFLGGSDGKESA